MLKKEVHILLTALMFFTRIPVPSQVESSESILQQSLKYFPLIGWLVGVICALVFSITVSIWPIPIAVLLSLLAGILVTGALHEDGFADCCDGFGGGWQADQVLAIMKDPRVGAYAVIGLILMIAGKVIVLTEIASIDIGLVMVAMLVAHAISRFLTLLIVFKLKYVQSSELSKSRGMVEKFSPTNLTIAGLVTFVPVLLLGDWLIIEAAICGLIITVLAGLYYYRRIRGYSGDCLGATQQISELTIYLSLLASWST